MHLRLVPGAFFLQRRRFLFFFFIKKKTPRNYEHVICRYLSGVKYTRLIHLLA